MKMPDPFSDHYSDLLDGTYDCVDRLVLNAYFSMGSSAGGLRVWWRQLFGTDDTLDNAHLMRLAGRFARRMRGWAKKKGIPVIKCGCGERKHDIAAKYLPSEPDRFGVFCILVGRAPAPVWNVTRSNNGGLHLQHKKPMPFVNHYHFHIIDEQWGWLTIKMSGHPPFGAQVMLNGHEYTARHAAKQGIAFTKEGNCFTEVSNATGLAKVADTLRSRGAVGRLIQVCERWIYSSCLCFALDFAEQERGEFAYNYSVYQAEYSRNLLFSKGGQMDRVFQGVIDRTRSALDIKTVKTIFGRKNRPFCHRNKKQPRFEVVVERPEYDLTVFKVHVGHLTLKIYSKGERVLRIEAVAHNTKDLRCGRRIEKYSDIVSCLSGMVDRFLEVLRSVDVAWITDDTLNDLSNPSRIGKTRVGGLEINKHRTRAAMEAAIALALSPRGFFVADFAAKVRETIDEPYNIRQAAYDIKKFRGKGFVRRIDKSRRYETTPRGLRSMTALALIRGKVIEPLLSTSGKLKRGPPSKDEGRLAPHYRALQRDVRDLFAALGMAA